MQTVCEGRHEVDTKAFHSLSLFAHSDRLCDESVSG
jgi:hypothetical protein